MARLLVILLGLYMRTNGIRKMFPLAILSLRLIFHLKRLTLKTKKVRDSAECPQCVVWKRAGKPEAGVVVEEVEVELAREPNDIDSEPELC